jgi:hypothetical protein
MGRIFPPCLRTLMFSATHLVCCESRRNDEVALRRKGRTHLRPGAILSLSQRTATVPLFYAVENRRHKACMFKVGDKSESVTADRDGSRGRILMPEAVHEQAIHPDPGNDVLWH